MPPATRLGSPLERAIGCLPPVYQTVVRMRDLEGRPVREAAAEVGRSEGAIHMIRSRAHRLLAQHLGPASQFLSGGA